MSLPERRGDDSASVPLERVMGAWGLAANLFNAVVGAGIFLLPATIARYAGSAAMFAYLACAIAMGAVALCFAAASSRVARAGGAYGFCTVAFGPFVGFAIGFLIWLGGVLGAAGIGSAIADLAAGAWPAANHALLRGGTILALFSVMGAANVAGVRLGVWVLGVLSFAKLVPLGLVVLAGVWFVSPHNLQIVLPQGGTHIGAALALGVYAFAGMETALGVSGEVRDPARAIPRALIGVTVAITLLYSLIQIVAQGVLGGRLGASAAPLADVMSVAAPALRPVLLVAAAISMLGYVFGDAMSAPRLLFAFARDGLAPSFLGRVHPRFRTPWLAIIVHAAIAAALAMSAAYEKLLILSALTSVGVYIVGCLAAVRLQTAGVAEGDAPLRMRFLPWIAAFAVSSMLAIAATARLGELIGLAAAIAIAALFFAFGHVKRERRQRA